MDWLFDQLCSVTTQDSELLQTFFLTYPFFTKWEDVMKGLASRWEVISESSIIIVCEYFLFKKEKALFLFPLSPILFFSLPLYLFFLFSFIVFPILDVTLQRRLGCK